VESTRSRRSSMTQKWRPSSLRRAASPDSRSHPIIVLRMRRGHPSRGCSPRFIPAKVSENVRAQPRLRPLALKGLSSTTDPLRAGRLSRGEEPAAGRPAMRDTRARRRYQSWATTCSAALRMDLSPRSEKLSVVTQRGPHNQRAAPCRAAPVEARTAPTGEVRTARAFARRTAAASGRGLRHPTTQRVCGAPLSFSAERTYL